MIKGVHALHYSEDPSATVADRGWGLATEIIVPGGLTVTLYQPRYQKG